MKHIDLDNFIASVEMTNYSGYPHYHARVRFEPALVDGELPYTLKRSDVAELNKEEHRGASSYRYKVGQVIEKFPDRETAREHARKFFHERLIVQGALLLAEGSRHTFSPRLILACVPSLESEVTALNAIFEEIENIWNKHEVRDGRGGFELPGEWEKQVDKLEDQWRARIKTAIISLA